MSRLTRWLSECEARLKAATPGPWEWQDWRDRSEPDFGQYRNSLVAPPETRPGYPGMFPDLGNRVLRGDEPPENAADAALIAAAPTDLARAASLLRMVAEAGCELLDERWHKVCAETCPDNPNGWCLVCRVNARAEAML